MLENSSNLVQHQPDQGHSHNNTSLTIGGSMGLKGRAPPPSQPKFFISLVGFSTLGKSWIRHCQHIFLARIYNTFVDNNIFSIVSKQ